MEFRPAVSLFIHVLLNESYCSVSLVSQPVSRSPVSCFLSHTVNQAEHEFNCWFATVKACMFVAAIPGDSRRPDALSVLDK